MIDLDDDRDVVVQADNMDVLPKLPDGSFQLIYIDPPFNTGGVQQRRTTSSVREDADGGDRTGFGGRRYSTVEHGRISYPDFFDDYAGFIGPRLEEARRLLTESGTLYFHIDWREAHYCKVLLDEIFGRDCFLNEIIWAYDYGGRRRNRWPA
ncbi:MAG: DNA methyltransferase, partial [Nocardioidaceae bacterium]